jgi:hypothetical protein
MMLDELLTKAVASGCKSVNPDVVADLAAAIMENPKYGENIRYNQFHHMLMARIARDTGKTEETLAHLARAIELIPTDDLNMMAVTTFVDAGRFDDARKFIEDADDRLPTRPLKRFNSQKNLDELLVYVNEMEKLASEQSDLDTGD